LVSNKGAVVETKAEESRIEPRYEIDIFWSDEDDAFIAVVPELPYCSAWGETYETALKEARVAISGHLKVAEKYGDPIPQPKYHQDVPEAEQQEASRASQQQALSQIAEGPTDPVRQSFQMLADSTAALQESTLRLTQNFFKNWIEQVNNQAQVVRKATQGLQEQSQRQREAVETLSKEGTNAYAEFLNSALSFYQETLNSATQVGQQNLQQGAQATQQAAQAGLQAASQADQQAMEAVSQSGQQAAQAASEAGQQGAEAANQSAQQAARGA
jgi:predicted RNase H-like HicB family nuclease